MSLEIGEFHSHDGWYFKRLEDGTVRVRYGDTLVATFPENEWASIVCFVSRKGETGDRWQQARIFHGLKP